MGLVAVLRLLLGVPYHGLPALGNARKDAGRTQTCRQETAKGRGSRRFLRPLRHQERLPAWLVVAHDLHGRFDVGIFVDQGAHGAHELGAAGMLEDVAADGAAGAASLEGVVDHGEQLAGGVHDGTAGDDDGHAAAGHDVGEGGRIARVGHLDDVGAELVADAGAVGHDFGRVGVGDLGTAAVDHGDERHAPVVAGLGDAAKVGEHGCFVGIAQVHVAGDGIGAVAYGLLDRADQGLGVLAGREVGGGGKVHDEADVVAPVAAAAADEALVHEHGVGAALGQVVDGLLHVDEAGQGAHGDAMVHGDDDGAAVVPVDDALETDLFAKVHSRSPSPVPGCVWCRRRRGRQMKRPRASLEACGLLRSRCMDVS